MQANKDMIVKAGKSTIKKMPVAKHCPDDKNGSSADNVAFEKASVASRVAARRQATDFVSEQGSHFHPAFSGPYMDTQSQAEPSSATPYEAQRATLNQNRSARLRKCGPLAFQIDHFATVIATFQRISKAKHIPEGFDLRGKHTWEEVMDVAHTAEAKVNADGSKNLFRKAGRGTQKYASSMRRMIDLVPGGDYTSALCGGLKIAFDVAAQMKDSREAIFKTFHEIPITVNTAMQRLQEHPDDEPLFDAVTSLYLVVLQSIETMLKWLLDKSTWNKIGSLLKQPWCEKSVENGLEDVKRQMSIVSERAITLHNERIGHMDSNLQTIVSRTDEIRLTTQSTGKSTQALHEDLVEMSREIRVIRAADEAKGGLIEVLCDRVIELSRRIKHHDHAQQRNAQHVARSVRDMKRELNTFTSKYDLATRNCGPGTHPLDQNWFDTLLEVEPEIMHQDEQIVMMEGGKAGLVPQAQGQWLLNNPRLQHWLTADETTSLLVDGNGNGSDIISPMSHVCALLITSLQRIEPVLTVFFFCGLHVSKQDPLSGPSGLVRSLISQILDIQEYSLDFIDDEYERRLQEWDIAYLMHLFQSLVDQLPQDRVLYCIIDGISFYERSIHNPELEVVIRGLTELAQDCGIGPIFKLLITSPLNNRCAAPFFAQDDRITVLTAGGHYGPLTAAQVSSLADKMRHDPGKVVQGVAGDTATSDDEGDYLQGNFSTCEKET